MSNARVKIILKTAIIGILVNIIIASLKIVIGVLSSSIAIISEGTNNFCDAFSSFLTFIGTKLSKKHPDKKHPFGYGRIEYLTSLIISSVILASGIDMCILSFKKIFNPEEINVSYLMLIIIGCSAIIKIILGNYTIKKGAETESLSLKAVGIECRNDSFISAITIAASVTYLLFDILLDAYAGVLISIFIIVAGFSSLKKTVSEILGRAGKLELATKLYKEIRSCDVIENVADMMLHNYGPDAWSGSANIEINHKKTIGEIYEIIHKLQLRIKKDFGVTMVFGIYAIDNEGDEIKNLRSKIAKFVRETEHVKSYHAVFMDKESNKIYCDLVVDYELKNWDKLEIEFKNYMKEFYEEMEIMLVIETEFV